MKQSYLKHYQRYSPIVAPLRYAVDSMFQRKELRKLALVNRQKDYVSLANSPKLFTLHNRLNSYVLDGIKNWNSYDYGEGYFYQSFKKIGISGFRNTEARIQAMNLKKWMADKTVLEIGCNSGFLSLSIAPKAKKVVGFDIAPHLIEIANLTAEYLHAKNTEFYVSSFENFKYDKKFDVILSFANHSTYDGNTKQSLTDYFNRCTEFLNKGGYFLFESHNPEIENPEKLEKICDIMKKKFTIISCELTDYGTFLDKGRSFIVARLKD